MNNPMQSSNLLGSPGGGPPIAKKQRGGTTPGSIKARSRRPPPPNSSAAAGGGPPRSSEVVDDAIARRRAELRRLQEKARGAKASSSASRPPTSSMIPPSIPPSRGPPAKHTSDIFPNVPKSPSMIPKPTFESSSNAVLAAKSSLGSSTTTTTKMTRAPPKGNPNLPPETPQAAIPPTPAVGRRLEFPSSQKTTSTSSQIKPKPPSAPPMRRARSKSPSRATSAGTNSSSAAAATNVPKANPPRAKSAPPRRPPGPPPARASAAPPSKPAAGFQPMPKVKAKKKAKSQRPAPVRPGTLLPTVKTKSPKNQQPEEEASKSAEPPKEKAAAPPTVKSPASPKPGPPTTSGPPITSSAAAAPPTSRSMPPTTTATSATSLTETPKTEKSLAPSSSGGADTPPSSGSSARRQKLQLMREQAMVASSLDTAAKTSSGPPTAAAAAPPTSSSFYTASSMPATAAFAKATASKTAPPEIPNLSDLRPAETKSPKKDVSKSPTRKSPIKSPSRKAPPSSSMQSAAQARLEDAYQKSEKEKLAALVKIKELEDQLSQASKKQLEESKQQHAQQKLDVQTLLQVAETQGPQAALEWAKQNNNGSAAMGPSSPKPASRTGFNTGMGATPSKRGAPLAPTPHRRARMAIKALKQQTMQQRGSDATVNPNESPEQTERRLIRKFKEAAKYVSYEFSSELATYIVRKPYGMVTEPVGLFEHCRPPQEKPDAYQRRAHVSDKTTIEVAAIVKADKTPLLVFGSAGIRYQTNPHSRNVPPDWKHFEDVDAEDRPLGHVTYIDGQANEREYSLDEILEEALLVREQYCGTITSTALALPDVQQMQQQQQQPPGASQKPPMADNKTKPKEAAPAPAPAQSKPPPQQQQQPPPPEADMDSGSSDVLVDFLGMVISFFFNLVWGIFVGTPLKICQMTVVLVVAAVIVQGLHLYLADGYNEWALREFSTSAASTCSSMLASDLTWFSNQHPGIM